MSVKEQVLTVFENNKGQYISGEDLAGRLSVSRSAVWKGVKALQAEGYQISAISNKGYCLSDKTDILSVQSIEKYLKHSCLPLTIEVYKSLASTNTFLKNLASQGASEGRVIIAEQQTQGKGRMNRQFISPTGSGIYMSLLLRPKISAFDSLFITVAAAVAVSEAIEKIAHQETKIKWVNDIYCHNKKVCGILTEASFDMESGGLEYAVLGIGINVQKPQDGFPPEIDYIAGAIFDGIEQVDDARSLLIAEVLQNFYLYYQVLEQKTFLQKYRERSLILGKEIMVIKGDRQIQAKALSIDDDCRLQVQFADGKVENLSSGEVSIKIQ